MLKRWNDLAQRFAKLKPREQLLISLGAAVLAYVLVDTFLISPALVQQRRLQAEAVQKRDDAVKLSAQLTTLKAQTAEDPDALNRKRLVELQAQLGELQQKVAEQSRHIVPADKMPAVLERMLAKHPRLELVELRTLPQVAIDAAPPAAGAAKVPAPAAAPAAPPPAAGSVPERRIYKHGLQLSLRGSYLELLDYLRSLEAQSGRLYWENLELAVEGYPVATLKVTLFTVSFDKAWMTV